MQKMVTISEKLLNAIKDSWRVGKKCAIKYSIGYAEERFYTVLDENGKWIINLSDYADDEIWVKKLKELNISEEVISEILELRRTK